MDSPDAELSIVILDDPAIADLNRRYLDREGPTNVIAFPMREGDFPEISPHLLGDVVISAETAAREAASSGIDTERRIDELLIHGILHLFGYDHEASEAEAQVMEEKSRELIERLDDPQP